MTCNLGGAARVVTWPAADVFVRNGEYQVSFFVLLSGFVLAYQHPNVARRRHSRRAAPGPGPVRCAGTAGLPRLRSRVTIGPSNRPCAGGGAQAERGTEASFLLKRFTRLYPLYWASLAVRLAPPVSMYRRQARMRLPPIDSVTRGICAGIYRGAQRHCEFRRRAAVQRPAPAHAAGRTGMSLAAHTVAVLIAPHGVPSIWRSPHKSPRAPEKRLNSGRVCAWRRVHRLQGWLGDRHNVINCPAWVVGPFLLLSVLFPYMSSVIKATDRDGKSRSSYTMSCTDFETLTVL